MKAEWKEKGATWFAVDSWVFASGALGIELFRRSVGGVWELMIPAQFPLGETPDTTDLALAKTEAIKIMRNYAQGILDALTGLE